MASSPAPRSTAPARPLRSLRPLRRSDPPPKPTGETAAFLADVVAGLGLQPKALPARYMFDTVGARLFACLAGSHDHHLTRSELSILRAHGREIGAAVGEGAQLVDLACGDGARTSILAEHLASPARIAVVDRAAGAATRLAAALAATHSDLPLLALDAQDAWTARIPSFARATRTVGYLPASIIGELEPREAKNQLRRLATECGTGGGLLVGVDLKKDAAELEGAYTDHAGVAGSFCLNLLARINRELGGSFQLSAFDHRAAYDTTKGRVELQLVSKRWQWAAVHGHWFNFGPGETITTLVAYKYTLEWFSSLAASAGWNVERSFVGEDRKYALVLLRTAPSAP
jgi:dimethylhistidine N-methyltransferase